jgi:hypothetical protein
MLRDCVNACVVSHADSCPRDSVELFASVPKAPACDLCVHAQPQPRASMRMHVQAAGTQEALSQAI